MTHRRARACLALLAAAGLAVALVGCGTGDRSGDRRLVIGTTADVQNFNPLVGNNRTDSWITNLMYPKLMGMDVGGRRTPYLAEKWWYEDGGRTARVSLRGDFKWSDGRPLTADDVVFTIDAIAKEKIGVVAGLIPAYRSARALSPTEVEFALSRPDGTFLDNVGFWMPIVPKRQFGRVGSVQRFPNDSDWVSAGPYRLATVRRGEQYVLKRVTPFPLAPGGRPVADEVVFRVYPDVNTEVLALRTGEVDAIANVLPPALARTVRADPDLRTVRVPSLGWADMQYNQKRPPLNRLPVRRALAAAVDYEAVREIGLGGNAVSTNSSVLTPAFKQWQDPASQPYRYDPALARRLLTGAGYADRDGDGMFDGLSLGLIYDQSDSNIAKWVQIVRESARRAGIDIELEGLERNTYKARSERRDFDIYAGSWAIMDNPPANLGLAFKCGGFINYGQVCDPRLDRLIDAAQAEVSPERARGPVQEAARLISQQVYDNVLYAETFTIAYSAKWTDFLVQPSELLSIVNPRSLARARPVR